MANDSKQDRLPENKTLQWIEGYTTKMSNIVVMPEAPTVSRSRKTDLGLPLTILIMTLLAAGIGSFVGMQLVNQTRHIVLEEKRAKDNPPAHALYDSPSKIVAIKPIIVNLAGVEKAFVRVEGSIVFKQEAKEVADVLTSQVESDISAYLRTLKVSDLEGATGLQNLREDLNQRAKIRADGNIREFILETMVIQ
nr:flagellar basal body-associated FliL family protein [uncultured Cohaesibacter sp.]